MSSTAFRCKETESVCGHNKTHDGVQITESMFSQGEETDLYFIWIHQVLMSNTTSGDSNRSMHRPRDPNNNRVQPGATPHPWACTGSLSGWIK